MTLMQEAPPSAGSGNGNDHVLTRVEPQRREIRIVQDDGPLANLMDTARFEHMQRIALVMSNGSLVPDHLKYEKGNAKNAPLSAQAVAANCFRVVDQALRWGFDPFAIIDETFVVGGKLGYQGKLVAAVINARAGLTSRLRYEFHATGDNRTVTVIGTFNGEMDARSVELRLGDARTDNQMWRKDPDQKLIYSGVVKWARRHCPEVVLGVLTDDDIERIEASRANVLTETPGQTQSRTALLAERFAAPSAPVVVPHPADDTRVIDQSTSNLPTPTEAENILQNAPRAPETQEPDTGGVDAEPPADAMPDLDSEGKFIAFAESVASRDQIDPKLYGAAIKELRLNHGIGGGKRADTLNRNKIAAAMNAGKFEWSSATVKP